MLFCVSLSYRFYDVFFSWFLDHHHGGSCDMLRPAAAAADGNKVKLPPVLSLHIHGVIVFLPSHLIITCHSKETNMTKNDGKPGECDDRQVKSLALSRRLVSNSLIHSFASFHFSTTIQARSTRLRRPASVTASSTKRCSGSVREAPWLSSGEIVSALLLPGSCFADNFPPEMIAARSDL